MCRRFYWSTPLTSSQDLDEDTVKLLHIAGADLLWRIILNANDEKLAAATIDLLVQEYLDVSSVTRSLGWIHNADKHSPR